MHVRLRGNRAVRVGAARYRTIRLAFILGMSMLWLVPSAARAESTRAFVSIDYLPDGPERQALCGAIWESLGVTGEGSLPPCARVHSPEGFRAWHQLRREGMGLRVSIERRGKRGLLLRIERWGLHDPSAVAAIDWSLAPDPPNAQRALVRDHLREFLAAEAVVRGDLLPPGDGVGGAGRVGLDAARYAARMASGESDVELGSLLEVPQTPAPKPNYLGTALDIGALLTVATIEYELDPSTNSKDWKYTWSVETLSQKFVTFKGIQFDDNAFRLNAGHSVSGSLYFLAARSRDLPFWQSFLVAIASAWLWELSTEFREVVSINDVITTPLGGLAIGESLFQLATFFRESEDTWWNQWLSDFLHGPPYFVWGRDHSVPGGLRLLDQDGFAARTWHRIRLEGGADAVDASAGGGWAYGGLLGVDAMLVQRPGYDRAGKVDEWVNGPLSTRLRLRGAWGDGGLHEFSLLAQTSYMGFYRQRVDAQGGGLRGYAAFASLGALFEYDERDVGPAPDEVLAGGPVGLTLHVAGYLGGPRLRATAELHPVFGQVAALGWRSYLAGGGSAEGARDVLVEHGYYYAFGLRPAFRFLAEYKGTEAGVEGRWYQFESVEGFLQQYAHPGPLAVDHRENWSVWVAQALPVRHLRLVLEWEHRALSGQVDGVANRAQDSRALVMLQWTL